MTAQGSSEATLRGLLPLALLLFALNAFRFVVDSAPGVTDVAHLRALTLPFGDLIGWIGGDTLPDLAPEPVRTAALPLLVDWLLWRIDPLGIVGLRIAHLACALVALGLLLQAIALRMDARSAVVAGFVVALSPRIIEPVVNLGPDPFVFTLFCLQLAILLSRGKIGGPAPLVAFAAASAATGLCGVTGMIASASLLAVLLYAAPDKAERGRRAIAAALALALWAVPLVVQLRAPAVTETMSNIGLARLGLKLFAHNADLLLLPGAALQIAGTLVLIALGTYSYVRRRQRYGRSERTHVFAQLLLATLAGAALVFLAGPVLRLYGWGEPPAQAWLALLLILLAASCFTPRLVSSDSLLQQLRRFSGGAMIAGAVAGTIAFQYRADWFAAGPEAGLQRALQGAGRDRAIVYTSYDWGRAYFPHAWLAPGDTQQWLLDYDGATVQRVGRGGQLGAAQPLSALEGYGTLVIARIDRRGWRDLHAVTNMQVIGSLPPARIEHFPRVWAAEPAQAAPGEYWLTTQLLRKAAR